VAIISLTSFGKRLQESTYRAVCTLLDQTVEARCILYLSEGSTPTEKLRRLEGLEIVEGVPDFGSYSKLVWSLQRFPNDVIVTADDDIYYPRDWLEKLLTTHKAHPTKVICHRAHGMTFGDGGIASLRRME